MNLQDFSAMCLLLMHNHFMHDIIPKNKCSKFSIVSY